MTNVFNKTTTAGHGKDMDNKQAVNIAETMMDTEPDIEDADAIEDPNPFPSKAPFPANTLDEKHQASEREVGSFTYNGALYVFVDCISLMLARNFKTKGLAYEHRLKVNAPTAGIEEISMGTPVDGSSSPPALLPGPRVYRSLFKLNVGPM